MGAKLNVYLIRISSRAYGFTVVALVATSEDIAMEKAGKTWKCYFGQYRGENYKINHSYAEVVGFCGTHTGAYVTMEFEE